MHVPASRYPKQGGAIGQAAMDYGEQYLVALRLQLKGNVAAARPGESQLAGRIEFSDPASHPALVAEAGRPLAGRIGQFVITPDEFERRINLQLHFACRQPFAAQFTLREISPYPLDGAGQQALDLQRGRI